MTSKEQALICNPHLQTLKLEMLSEYPTCPWSLMMTVKKKKKLFHFNLPFKIIPFLYIVSVPKIVASFPFLSSFHPKLQ